MRFIEQEAYTFDDMLLVPRYTDIDSRKDVSTHSVVCNHWILEIPIISSNMDTITGLEMMCEMNALGGAGILHRYLSIQEMIDTISKFFSVCLTGPAIVSIGVNDDSIERLEAIKKEDFRGSVMICIDVAHGHCKKMGEMIKRVREEYGYEVIAGNVATAEGAEFLCKSGANIIKCGIGPGSLCTTRLITGAGYPQLSAIIECSRATQYYGVGLIADGGITKSGDVVKALACGADAVMLGGLLAGTNETPGEHVHVTVKDNKVFPQHCVDEIQNMEEYKGILKKCKKFRGMASKDAVTGWKKGDYHATPEGESHFVECKGPVKNIINDLVGGLRSGMTYCNARNLAELRQNSVFVKVSSNTLIENRPHKKDGV